MEEKVERKLLESQTASYEMTEVEQLRKNISWEENMEELPEVFRIGGNLACR